LTSHRCILSTQVREAAGLLKTLHAQENQKAAPAKAALGGVVKLAGMNLGQAAEPARAGVAETPAYMSFPREPWTRLRTNNPSGRLSREINR
jgi:putative transposase